MHLAHVHVEEFRAYRLLDLELPEAGIRMVGPNASGKTSLIEAIAMLAIARSPRARNDRELIRWQSGEEFGSPPYARCQGLVVSGNERIRVDITIEADTPSDSPSLDRRGMRPPGTVRKRCRVDGRPVRAMDLVGRLRVVLFGPEDVALVAGPPSDRRRHLDLTISQLDNRYLRALSRFNRILTQRNGLLRDLSRDTAGSAARRAATELGYWDDELVGAGSVIISGRALAIAELTHLAAARFAQLTGGGQLDLHYQTNSLADASAARHIAARARNQGNQPADAEATVERDFRRALGDRRADEIRRGVSLLGPHRDDLVFSVDDVDLATFGSRGQHRLAVLALKLAEADFMVQQGGEAPVILLDDVLSELDPERSRLLIETVSELGAQVVISATDAGLLNLPGLRDMPLYASGGGSIRQM